jgi:hypothetical protein
MMKKDHTRQDNAKTKKQTNSNNITSFFHPVLEGEEKSEYELGSNVRDRSVFSF